MGNTYTCVRYDGEFVWHVSNALQCFGSTANDAGEDGKFVGQINVAMEREY